jgi:hypothetical protein
MRTEKICPHCAAWTHWDKKPTDRCSHCNELLDQVALKEKEVRDEADRVFYENDFFRVREEDGVLMRLIRRTAWIVHLFFAAITWFFLWMVATTPA